MLASQRTRKVLVLLVVLVLPMLGWLLISHPRNMRYAARYKSGVTLTGRGGERYFSVDYYGISVGNAGRYVLSADGQQRFVPGALPPSPRFTLYLDGRAFIVDQITRQELESLQPDRESNANGYVYGFSAPGTALSIFIVDDRVTHFSILHHGGGVETLQLHSIKVAVGDSPPFALPISEEQMQQSFGEPDALERSRVWVNN